MQMRYFCERKYATEATRTTTQQPKDVTVRPRPLLEIANRPPEHNRAEVARGSIGAVVHVAKLMADDPVLVCAVSAAVYNFVSRQGG